MAFTYSGTSKAQDLQLYLDGVEASTEIVFDNLYKSIQTVQSGNHALTIRPVRVAKSYRSFTGENGIFKGKLDDIYIYSRALAPFEVTKIAGLKASLVKSGIEAGAMERVHSPAGIEIGAVTPAEIAVSILAELVRVRRTGTQQNASQAPESEVKPSDPAVDLSGAGCCGDNG